MRYSASKYCILIIVMIIIGNVLPADTKGYNIAFKCKSLPEPDDQYARMTMVLLNKRGDKKIRVFDSYSKLGEDGRNSFINFIEPVDVRGTKMLTIGHEDAPDEQRLFLPALGKVRRIASSTRSKSGKFMGSDIYFYDMEDHSIDDFTYEFDGEEVVEGQDCFIVNRYPKDKYAPYSKQRVWYGKDNYFIYKIECYERKQNPVKLKTILFQEVVEYDGFLISLRMVVDNHLENHYTGLLLEDIRINIGLNDSLFTIQNLTK